MICMEVDLKIYYDATSMIINGDECKNAFVELFDNIFGTMSGYEKTVVDIVNIEGVNK